MINSSDQEIEHKAKEHQETQDKEDEYQETEDHDNEYQETQDQHADHSAKWISRDWTSGKLNVRTLNFRRMNLNLKS